MLMLQALAITVSTIVIEQPAKALARLGCLVEKVAETDADVIHSSRIRLDLIGSHDLPDRDVVSLKLQRTARCCVLFSELSPASQRLPSSYESR